jgi:hypothetical protein
MPDAYQGKRSSLISPTNWLTYTVNQIVQDTHANIIWKIN